MWKRLREKSVKNIYQIKHIYPILEYIELGMDMSTIAIRAMGELQDLKIFQQIMEKTFKKPYVSGPFKNQRDPGYRLYLIVKIGMDEAHGGS